MSTPRFRQHTDGRLFIHDRDTISLPLSHQDRVWRRVQPAPHFGVDRNGPERLSDADVHGEGWSEAALVVLPEPDGAADEPFWIVGNPSRYVGTERRERMERDAAALLAAARWEATP